MKTSEYFDITLSDSTYDSVKAMLSGETPESFQKVLYEDENFQLGIIKGTNIYKQTYYKYEVRPVKGSLVDECVVDVYIESADKEDDGQVFYWPKSVKVKWGMNSDPISVNKMIQALTEASKFSQAVSKILSIRIAD
jgi:hypothetical protein